MSDHYHTLGVSRFASEARVRDAYVRLMKRYHAAPERSGVSQDRLRQIGVAYWELRHPERRMAYDACLREGHRYHDRTVRRIVHGTPRSALFQHMRVRHADWWLFLILLPLLAGGVMWAKRHHVSALPGGMLKEVSVVTPSVASNARLLEQLKGDYALMATLNDQKQINSDIDRCLAALRANDLTNVRRLCASLRELEWSDDGLARRFRAAVPKSVVQP